MNGREHQCSKMCVTEIKPNEPTRDYIRYCNYPFVESLVNGGAKCNNANVISIIVREENVCHM